MLRVNNKKEDFEREGQLFDHIKVMYSDSRGYEHYWQNRRKNLIIKYLGMLYHKGYSLLDIGCAEGYFVSEAQKMGYYALGCDISRSKLIRADVAVIESDAQSLPFKDESFEVVILSRTLECIPDDEKALFEASRVGKKYLIVTVPNASPSLISKFERKCTLEGHRMMNYAWGVKARTYTRKELKDKLKKYGEICKIGAIAPFGHFIPFSQKIPITVHHFMDDIFEGKSFLENYGHDIFALVKL